MSKGNTAYASGVHRYYALRRFCSAVVVAASVWFVFSAYHAYVVVKGLQPHQHAHFGTLYLQCTAGSIVAMFVFSWLRTGCDKEMRRNWDHAMVSNLGNNIGGNLPARVREKIAAIIVSQNK